tara:strand:+ start:3168 stop:3587 length:420 start_codon:yes stop_codon:yes gene_type:complete
MSNSTEEFLEKISIGKETLALDFDGVIHDDYLRSAGGDDGDEMYDGTIYGEPFDGIEDALIELSKKYRIVIYTCKANPTRPLIDGKTGTELIWEWLKEYKLDKYISDIDFTKPHARYYIDDKGYKFENWNDTMEFLDEK